MAKLHSQLTGNDLHAPKGFELEDSTVRFYLSQSTNILTASVDIVPNGVRNLGSAENPWTELFVSSASVKFVNPDTQTVLQTISATDSGIDFGTAAITASAIVDESGTTIGAPAGTVSSSAQIIYNDISNNPFTNNNGVLSASLSIIPTSAELDLGSAAKPFRDVYVSSGSLYVNGQQVLSTTGTELRVTTDTGESLKLIEAGNDTITFETSDGNVVLTSTGTGVIQVDTDMQMGTGQKITSADASGVRIGDGLGVTGSLDVTEDLGVAGNLVVNGTGSFAVLESVTGSAKIIGDAFIVLNNNTPSERYAGISVYDSGSAGVSASFQFDGQSNDWFYEYSDDGGATNEYGVTIFGPEYNTKGTPTYLTSGSIPKGDGGHHLYDSNISDDGTLITLGSNTSVTGTLVATGTTLISSSVQVNADSITNFDSNVKAKMDADNVVSGSVDSFAVSNSADNRVITSVDSSNGNAEANLTFDGSTLTVNGTIVETSAREYKDNITSLESELPSVMKLNPVTYSWKGKEDTNYGFIADEVGEVYPELLNETQSGIQYSKMVSVLTKAIQELHELVEKQEQRIKELEQ